ncbi:MAG: tetratricopeptide repeat protein [Moraxellaceae bacterium]|nr:tetratricopeptide repeat protein [Moraxellaceae bacterium]MDZ4298286.1 tetratricopeptide repeat protein [Moraxellaceae bacterium]MDZ4386051.1 tetratricopeptide repeat protein [Moraxellaceae bacterium]
MSNDDEVLLQVKTWWQRYGTTVLLAVAIGLFAFAGNRFWQNSQLESAVAAQGLQEQLTTISQRLINNPEDTAANGDLQRIGRQIMDEYPRTPQATDAALMLAARSVDSNDLAAAEKHLRWALGRKPAADTRALIEVRLARVLAANDKAEDALVMLANIKDPALAPMVDEIKGDILLQQGQLDAAAKAYQSADAALAAAGEERPLLALKLADVGLEPAPREQESVQ